MASSNRYTYADGNAGRVHFCLFSNSAASTKETPDFSFTQLDQNSICNRNLDNGNWDFIFVHADLSGTAIYMLLHMKNNLAVEQSLGEFLDIYINNAGSGSPPTPPPPPPPPGTKKKNGFLPPFVEIMWLLTRSCHNSLMSTSIFFLFLPIFGLISTAKKRERNFSTSIGTARENLIKPKARTASFYTLFLFLRCHFLSFTLQKWPCGCKNKRRKDNRKQPYIN